MAVPYETGQHLFCKIGGIRSFGIGRSPRWGDFYAVTVSCLVDMSDEELANAPVTYLDGRQAVGYRAVKHAHL